MMKNVTLLEVVRKSKDAQGNDRENPYRLLCENMSTLGELFDVLCEMRGYVMDRIKEYHVADAGNPVAPIEPPPADDPEVEKPESICIEC